MSSGRCAATDLRRHHAAWPMAVPSADRASQAGAYHVESGRRWVDRHPAPLWHTFSAALTAQPDRAIGPLRGQPCPEGGAGCPEAPGEPTTRVGAWVVVGWAANR